MNPDTKNSRRRPAWKLWILLFLWIPAVQPAETDNPEETELCMSCHSDPELQMTLENGEQMPLYVDLENFQSSIHGDKLNCTDCHTDISDYPHPEKTFKNRRNFSITHYESCKKCHFSNYTKTLESIHYSLLSRGDSRAPTCVDCHGAHNISRPDQPRSRVSQTCKACHQKIYDVYKNSVHGKALLQEGNIDVPVCTDCHQAHNIEDPRTQAFLARTPELCGKCHADEKLMRKYGLSTAVLETYLRDFHGVSASFYRTEGKTTKLWKAVCTDCHGVHDITGVSEKNSPVLKENLLRTCRKCHPDATTNFPDAWLSHYEPTPKRAALVYYIKLFYRFFIPFTVGGLVLHILLHFWRIAVNR